MLINEIPKDKIKFCMESLQTMFSLDVEHDVAMIKRALSLFRNGAVFNAAIDDNTVKAEVLDNNNTFEIELELDFIEISYCSCLEAEDSFCVHKLAALFYLFSLFDSPGEFYSEWKAGNQYLGKNERKSAAKKTQSAATQLRTRPYQEDSLQSWLTFFNKTYKQFLDERALHASTYWNYYRSTTMAEDLYDNYYSMLMDTILPSSRYGQLLFQLHAAITVFEKIITSAGEGATSVYNHHNTRKYLQEIVGDIVELINSAREEKGNQTADDRKILSETPQRVKDILFMSRDFQYDRFYIFQGLTSNLINQRDWIDGLKLDILSRSQKEEALKEIGKINFTSECRLALAHFNFMDGDNQKAIRQLSEGPANEVYFYTTWFKALALNKAWKRLEVWLPFIEERMAEFIHQYGDKQLKRELSGFYLFFIKEYADENHSESSYIHTLQSWLPYSYADFCEYLLEKKDYKKWTELQLFVGISIPNLDRELLKEIEKHNRASLLPLYHHAAEECIAMKSRPAYREAVKYLRKLRTHYRALKKEELWNQYIDMLSTKYKRLRAFQEELRKGKGKLIND